MSREFNGEPVVRAAMLPRDEPFDNRAGADFQPLDLVQRLRVEIVLSSGIQWKLLRIELFDIGKMEEWAARWELKPRI